MNLNEALAEPDGGQMKDRGKSEWPDMACDNVKWRRMFLKSSPDVLVLVPWTCKICEGCQQTKVHQRIRGLLFGMRLLGGDWYHEVIGHDELHARGKYVKRAGGDFRTIRQPDGTHIIIANRPIRKHDTPVDNVRDVEEIAVTAVQNRPDDRKQYVAGSQTWPKDD